jgi:hypothetical protein
MRVGINGWVLFRLWDFCIFQIKLISYMKYLLTLMILITLSCKKSANNERQAAADPTATNCNCQTVWYGPSISNINWSVVVNVPDTNAVASLTLRLASNLEPAFIIDRPKSQTYSQLKQTNRACPSGAVDVYYFFEWKMADGTIKKESPFVVRG